MTKIIEISYSHNIATLHFNRPEKRNAVNDQLILELFEFFKDPPKEIKAVILTGNGGHFCAGLDLAELKNRSAEETVHHSRHWHHVMDLIEHGGLPVLAAMSGSVIGGGLEIATSCHVRIAEPSVKFQLPEGKRGIFVGGGAAVRVGRIMGADRLREMMLTARKYNAEEGLALGLAHYCVGENESLTLATELAGRIAKNAPLSNYFMLQAISRIGEMPRDDGLFTESLAAALAQTSQDAQEGLRAFLEKREPQFR